jgi:predicted TIM-barrel fold metal-dependent hydrolase
LKLAFLEIGATWLPYYLDRLDEHWEKRGKYEMPLLKNKPSDIVRQSKMYFSVEPGESQLAATVNYVGAEHFLYASDIPHWDNEFPENLIDLRNRRDLSEDAKRKILYDNAKELFAL